MNNENTASQPKTASIGDDDTYLDYLEKWHAEMVKYLADQPHEVKSAFDQLAAYLDSKLRAPADQAASAVEIDRIAQKAADKLMRVWGTRKGDIRAAFISSTKECINAVLAAPQQSLAPAADVDELHFNAQRLRSVAALVGVPVDGDDAHVDSVRGALLGQIAFALRKAAAEGQVSAAELVLTYTVDGEVMSPLEYIDYLHGEITTAKRKTLELQRQHDERGLQIGRLETALTRASEGQAQTSAADTAVFHRLTGKAAEDMEALQAAAHEAVEGAAQSADKPAKGQS